ncbi:MAG: chemotaxis protein CheW [Alphaproteobacteria bacterium]|uniref:Chemotaxis protein CheW n=1 Tax=Candidatus Nitrobium versatile TaxID=2884831 RepID=A0A953JDF3_9BACT|nr:chemotaxis protein CheW [Candidatus Nitrobium versatile]
MEENTLKSDCILEELRRRKSRGKIVDVEEEKVKVVIFSLLDEWYAFYGSEVKEILHLTEIFYVPGSPDCILGVINVRGDIESVIAVNAFLGLPEGQRTHRSRIALVAAAGVRSGILVDSIIDVVDVPVRSISPPLATLDSPKKEYVAGSLHFNSMSVTLLNIGTILGRIAA